MGATPLHLASQRGHVLIVKALVSHGADIRALDKNGRLPLHVSTASGHWGPAQLFILKGLDINTPDRAGNTPLHGAVESGYLRTVKLLLARRADICIRNNAGETPLDLVENKLSNRPLMKGMTPFQVSIYQGYERIRIYLRAVLMEAYKQAAEQGDYERMQTLIETQPQFLNMALYGEKPVHVAARAGQLEVLKLMVAHGADLNDQAATLEGNYVIHDAAEAGQREIVAYLLSQGVDSTVVNAAEKTPLDLAQQSGVPQVLILLQQQGQGGK